MQGNAANRPENERGLSRSAGGAVGAIAALSLILTGIELQFDVKINPTLKLGLETVVAGVVAYYVPDEENKRTRRRPRTDRKPATGDDANLLNNAAAQPSNPHFSTALKFTLQWEGGHSKNIHDYAARGLYPGETIHTSKGIIQSTYDEFRASLPAVRRPVRLITDDEVEQIYHQRYWLAAKCDRLPLPLAISHFDWAVNSGVARAVMTLQRCLGDVAVDGIWGAQTEASVQSHDLDQMHKLYNQQREVKYQSWGKGSQRVFLQGWLNRLSALRMYVSKF